jgi:hypothetical protein
LLFYKRKEDGDITIRVEKFIQKKPNHQKSYIFGDYTHQKTYIIGDLKKYSNKYFWRTVQKQEIDFVEETNGQVTAYEFKWNSKGKAKIPTSFINLYNATSKIIEKENFREYVKKNEI